MNHISQVIEHELGKDEIRLSGRGLCAQMVILCRIVSAMFACSCPIVGGEVALCTLRCHGILVFLCQTPMYMSVFLSNEYIDLYAMSYSCNILTFNAGGC